MARELHTKSSARNNWQQGVQESQVSILWNCGLWAHHVGLKWKEWWYLAQPRRGGMSVDSLSAMSATMLVPRARDEENHFPARWTRRANRQGSRPSVVTGISSTIVTGSYWPIIHRGVYISSESLLLRLYRSQECQTQQWKGKYEYQIKQNNGKENVFKHIFQGYILPKDKQNMITMTWY